MAAFLREIGYEMAAFAFVEEFEAIEVAFKAELLCKESYGYCLVFVTANILAQVERGNSEDLRFANNCQRSISFTFYEKIQDETAHSRRIEVKSEKSVVVAQSQCGTTIKSMFYTLS
jgi:hypothetical protein